jgi:hypothetical protein
MIYHHLHSALSHTTTWDTTHYITSCQTQPTCILPHNWQEFQSPADWLVYRTNEGEEGGEERWRERGRDILIMSDDNMVSNSPYSLHPQPPAGHQCCALPQVTTTWCYCHHYGKLVWPPLPVTHCRQHWQWWDCHYHGKPAPCPHVTSAGALCLHSLPTPY